MTGGELLALAGLELIRDAIAISDAAEKACPVNQGKVKPSDTCPLCGALANQTCFRTAGADYRAMKMVRRSLATPINTVEEGES